MSQYIQKSLIEGEKLLYEGHRHWIVFFTPLIWFIFTIVVVVYFVSDSNWIVLIPFIITLVTGVSAVIDYFTTEIAVTDRRVLVKVGWIARDSIETTLQNIASIEVEQTIFGRIFDYGTIIICDRGNVRSPYWRITHPFKFRRAVQKQLKKP